MINPAKIIAGAALLLAALGGPAGAADLRFEQCRLFNDAGTHSVDAQCGTLTVPEDPARPDGQTIDLFVARIAAIAPTPQPDPFTLIQGGPGGSSVDFYVSFASAFDRLREFRDIIVVDQRGTGRSNALHCDLADEAAAELNAELAGQFARDCLAGLEADPRFYTTSVAVQDLERLREALGVQAWNIYGVSYGTRVALQYLRQHPERARTAIIDGVAPADWVLGPDIARFAQDALDALFSRCQVDAACSSRFGDLADKFARLQRQLGDAPVTVKFNHPVTAVEQTFEFLPEHLVLVTRMFSYQSESIALLPLLISEAADNGNFQPYAAQALMVGEAMSQALALGMHNSVVCTEDLPFVQDESGLEQTYMGALQMQTLRALCADWPSGIIDEDFKTPVVSTQPVLILSGQYDPVTPPGNGARAATTLANHLAIVAPGQGHGIIGRGCIPRLAAKFVETANLADLDTECVQRLAPMPFFFSFSGPQP